MGTVLLDPWEHPSVYDTIALDGVPSPGPCALSAEVRRKLKLESQQSIGFTGAFLVFRGEELPSLPYKLRLWTPEHFKKAGPFIDLLLEGYKRRLQRVMRLDDQSIAHLGISKVVFEDLGELKQLQRGEIPHEISFTLKMYQKRKPLVGPPRGPKSETEQQIEKIEQENAKLEKELQAAEKAAAKGK